MLVVSIGGVLRLALVVIVITIMVFVIITGKAAAQPIDGCVFRTPMEGEVSLSSAE